MLCLQKEKEARTACRTEDNKKQQHACQLLTVIMMLITASDLESNCTSWHKSCHLKFNYTKLARAMKCASQENEFPMRPSKRKPPAVSTVRINSSTPASADRNCLFYQLAFYALTGCNTTSSFKGKGKKLAWQAYADATETLEHLANHPFQCLERTSNDSLWSGMTEQALSLQSTRSGGNSSVGEVDLWRGYLRQRTHFPSMFGEQCTKLTTCTQVLPSLVGARSQHPRIHGTQKMFVQGKLYSNCICCKPNSPVHIFVIVNAINGDCLQQ